MSGFDRIRSIQYFESEPDIIQRYSISLQRFKFVVKKNRHMCEKSMNVNSVQLSYFADQGLQSLVRLFLMWVRHDSAKWSPISPDFAKNSLPRIVHLLRDMKCLGFLCFIRKSSHFMKSLSIITWWLCKVSPRVNLRSRQFYKFTWLWCFHSLV